MIENLKHCITCPRKCGVNRVNGERGYCKSSNDIKIALASLHYFEEPCISGTKGSGTVFFSNCNMECVYCQNYEISHGGIGKNITIEHLSDIFLSQQEKGANNINLVTPTIYVHQIIEAIKISKKNGLKIPIIYNTNGYENVETLKLLEGLIDIYLPDFKYYYDEIAFKYSGIKNYSIITQKAILEMYRQVGGVVVDKNGLMKKGLMIRHLVLPSYVGNTKKVLSWIKENLSNDVYVSVMAQYFPTYKACNIKELNRKITKDEYNEVEQYLFDIGIENGYIQELGEHEEEYVPKFDLSE